MKCLGRNKMSFHYALYERREDMVDEYENTTGEFKLFFSNPAQGWANISAAKGETQTRQFGENEKYDKVLVTESTPIDEYSILWVDTVPQLAEDGSLALDDDGEVITPHDYIVKKVAKSLNNVALAINKVNVSG